MQHLLHSDEPSQPVDDEGRDRTDMVSRTDGVSEVITDPKSGKFIIRDGIASKPTFRPIEPGQTIAVATEPFQLQEKQNLQAIDQTRLMEIRSNVQEKLGAGTPIAGSTKKEVERLDI
jgi:hypothetical protein